MKGRAYFPHCEYCTVLRALPQRLVPDYLIRHRAGPGCWRRLACFVRLARRHPREASPWSPSMRPLCSLVYIHPFHQTTGPRLSFFASPSRRAPPPPSLRALSLLCLARHPFRRRQPAVSGYSDSSPPLLGQTSPPRRRLQTRVVVACARGSPEEAILCCHCAVASWHSLTRPCCPQCPVNIRGYVYCGAPCPCRVCGA